MKHSRSLVVLLSVSIGLFAVSACGDDGDGTTVDDPGDGTTTTAEEEGGEDAASEAESVSVFDLEAGMCIESLGREQGTVEELDVVDCDVAHEAEVFSVFDLEGDDDADFPGPESVDSDAESGCAERFEDYVGIPLGDSRFRATYLAPNEETWAQGDREVVCVAFAEDGDLEESIEGSEE